MKSLINIQKNNKVKIIEIAIFLFFLILLFGGIFAELEYIKETPSSVSYTHLTLPTKA